MNYLDFATAILKKHHYRITAPRLKVLKVLSAGKKTLNAYDIAGKIKDGGVDISTIYRILEVLQKLHLVHFVKESQGFMACRNWKCENSSHCHHQFVCRKCTRVEELHIDDRVFMRKVERDFSKYLIDGHYLELSGLCERCRGIRTEDDVLNRIADKRDMQNAKFFTHKNVWK